MYAYLQLARDGDARRVVDEGAGVTGFTTLRFAGPYVQAAMPARYAVERGDWTQAMALGPQPGPFPFTVALTHFARGLGAPRSGSVAAAERRCRSWPSCGDGLRAAKNESSATESSATEVEVSRLGGGGLDGSRARLARRGAHTDARGGGHRGPE